jgi:hypothetical protein
MQVTINFVYTPAGRAALAKNPPNVMNFQVPGLEFVPLAEDLVMFSDSNDAPMFRVVNRLFIWRSATELVLQPLLDYEPPASDHGP